MCHAEEGFYPFAALIIRQATKRLIRTARDSSIRSRRKVQRISRSQRLLFVSTAGNSLRTRKTLILSGFGLIYCMKHYIQY